MAEPIRLRGLSREPTQARSRARVSAIYDAACRLLAAEGVESVTMRRLAEQARVPVGTVYQFFQDKDAILDAVVHTHNAGFESVLAGIVDAAATMDRDTLIDTMLDRFVERYRASPAYVAIWAGHHLSPQMQQTDDTNVEAVADVMRSVLLASDGVVDSADLHTACRVAIQAADALLQLAFRLDRAGDAATLTEVRRIEHLYLDDIATNPRYR